MADSHATNNPVISDVKKGKTGLKLTVSLSLSFVYQSCLMRQRLEKSYPFVDTNSQIQLTGKLVEELFSLKLD